MRVQTEEWRRFVPGVRMYKGKKTFFYNGEELWDEENTRDYLIYDDDERQLWEAIIILPGVEVIPEFTFGGCRNVEVVIMADTVKRIERGVFEDCSGIEFVKLSRNLEYIGNWAFYHCESLTTIFIPPSCTEIGTQAFWACTRLLIVGLPQNVELREKVFELTALIKKSPSETDKVGLYDEEDEEAAVQWVKSMNNDDAYALHRACASFNPLSEVIHDIVKRQGIKAMRMPNSIGITPSQYLEANTFSDISEKEIVNKYILDMMGEIV